MTVLRDGTAECVRQYATTHPAVRLLQNPGNRGKGYAVRHGMLEAKGDWILFTDADLSAPISEIDRLFTAATSAGADVAIGSRALDRSLIGVHQSASREYAGRIFNFVMRLITGLSWIWTPSAGSSCIVPPPLAGSFRSSSWMDSASMSRICLSPDCSGSRL